MMKNETKSLMVLSKHNLPLGQLDYGTCIQYNPLPLFEVHNNTATLQKGDRGA